MYADVTQILYTGKWFRCKISPMHENTKRLRELMTANRLRATDVAEITRRETTTVHIWRCRSSNRIIPTELLTLVELTVAARAGAIN